MQFLLDRIADLLRAGDAVDLGLHIVEVSVDWQAVDRPCYGRFEVGDFCFHRG